jgi:sensor histidine kinase regulating citrate/malate metabolism
MRYSRVDLRIQPTDCAPVYIDASAYLLEVIFWNIWLNAQQAIGLNCEITIQMRLVSQVVDLLITDNGGGIPAELQGIAFHQIYSTKQLSRGRGLLEVQEAVGRLQGSVRLIETSLASCRIQITFPVRSS